jgi:hypothetical protein
MRAFIATIFLSTSLTISTAQSVSTLMGARSGALGYASETLSDEWSILNNVGGLAQVRKPSIAFACEVNPALEGANRIALALSTPVSKGTVGLGIFRFGDNIYNEQVIAAGYSNRIGITSLGAKVTYTQYQAEGFGTSAALSLSFGGITNLTRYLSIGAFITNVNQPIISKINKEKLPTLLDAGISLKASETFLFVAGIQKDLDNSNPVLKFGIEHIAHPKLIFRTGFNLHPDAAFFGFGFKQRKIKIDYAIQYREELNLGHQISFIYAVR